VRRPSGLWCAAALLLAACAPRRSPHPLALVPPAPAAETRETTIANGFISLRLDVPSGGDARKPVVLSPIADHRRELLEAGIIVVWHRVNWEVLAPLIPPPPAVAAEPPGPSVGAWLLAAPTAKTVGQSYFGLINHDATSAIPAVLDYLTTLPEVDPSRIGIEGASTTGFIALEAVAHDPRLAAAVVASACGDYFGFLHRSNLAMAGKPLDLDPAYARRLRGEQPIAHPTRLTHAALLLLNGARDPAVPLACAKRTDVVLRAAYRRAGVPERYRAVVYPDYGHNLGPEARAEAAAWWARWLGAYR
jgi:dienelactone hydrolase